MWEEIIGGGALGLLGGLLGGDAAEDQANANQRNSLELMQKQYGYGNDARMRMAGELYGDGALQYLYNTSRPEDFDSYFGKGANKYYGTPADQRGKPRQQGQNGGDDAASRFARSISGKSSLDAFSNNGFHNWFARQYGRWPTGDEVQQAYKSLESGAGLGQGNGNQDAGDEFDPSSLDRFGNQYKGQRGIYGQLEDLAGYGEQQGNGILSQYDNSINDIMRGYDDTVNEAGNTGAIDTMAAGLEDMAGKWGQGREQIIQQDADRSLANANQGAIARLGAMGLGNSTLVGNQMSSNAMESNRNVARAKQDLSEAQLDRTMSARQYRTNLMDSNKTRKLGAMGARNSAFAGLQQGRTALLTDNLSRNLGLRQQPINTRLGMAQSPIMNPGLNMNTAGFFQPSGAGSTQSAFGGYLGQLGGQLFEYGMNKKK
jgi:hypothetical protein